MSDQLSIACFWISTAVVYLQCLHGWCHMKLLPSWPKFCVHHTTMHHVTSCKATYIKVYACLAVTCHLHFWRNDQDLLHATAVTQGWNGYQNKSQHKKLTPEKKISSTAPAGNPGTFQSQVRCSNHWTIPAPISPLRPTCGCWGKLSDEKQSQVGIFVGHYFVERTKICAVWFHKLYSLPCPFFVFVFLSLCVCVYLCE